MEPLVSEETKEMLASWVPGASRWEGDCFFPPNQEDLMLEGEVSGVRGQVSGVRCGGIRG